MCACTTEDDHGASGRSVLYDLLIVGIIPLTTAMGVSWCRCWFYYNLLLEMVGLSPCKYNR